MKKDLNDIFKKGLRDDESLIKLSKEIGKISYCLSHYYKDTFNSVQKDIGNFFH